MKRWLQGELDKCRSDLNYVSNILQTVKTNNDAKNKEDLKTITDQKEAIKEREEAITKLTLDLDKATKDMKQLKDENVKLRQRIQRIKNKRFRIEDNQKICKKCGKEYLEKENYNWSCRTHTSEHTGEMYWCCGKTSKDAEGCKISKHE
jgi:chromosome segregation ATPase